MTGSNLQSGRMVIIGHEPPFPPNHGGKVDTWNRIAGFSTLGVKILLIYWYDNDRLNPADRKEILNVVHDVIELPRSMTLLDLFHPVFPPRMMSCRLNGRAYKKIFEKVNDFKPDCIWLDLWYGYLTARVLASGLNLPLIYRSQNNETMYFKQLYHDAKGLVKLKLFLNLIRLKKAERLVRNSSDLIYEISIEDAEYVKRENPSYPVKVLLPTWLYENTSTKKGDEEEPHCDILFAGNLHNPSNVSGLKWFAEQVLHLVREQCKGIRVIFTGSSPSDALISLCEKYSIRCIPDPIRIDEYYEKTKVIINPQLDGSGVSIKMIELLSTTRPIVTTTIGARGLPADIVHQFIFADSKEGFARRIIECLPKNHVDIEERKKLLKEHFGLGKLEKVLQDIHDAKKTIQEDNDGR